jgi:hypothetical protein
MIISKVTSILGRHEGDMGLPFSIAKTNCSLIKNEKRQNRAFGIYELNQTRVWQLGKSTNNKHGILEKKIKCHRLQQFV